MSFGSKLYNFISLYRSPSQLPDVLEKFANNVEPKLDKSANKTHI